MSLISHDNLLAVGAEQAAGAPPRGRRRAVDESGGSWGCGGPHIAVHARISGAQQELWILGWSPPPSIPFFPFPFLSRVFLQF